MINGESWFEHGEMTGMRFIVCLILVSAAAFFFLVPSVHWDGIYLLISGQDVDLMEFNSFKEGETKRQDIIEAFGEPARLTTDSSGMETLEYESVHHKDSGDASFFLPLVSYTRVFSDKVIIEIVDGTLRKKVMRRKVENDCSSLFGLYDWMCGNFAGTYEESSDLPQPDACAGRCK